MKRKFNIGDIVRIINKKNNKVGVITQITPNYGRTLYSVYTEDLTCGAYSFDLKLIASRDDIIRRFLRLDYLSSGNYMPKH